MSAMKGRSRTLLGGAAREEVACPGNMTGRHRPQQPKRAVVCNGLWSVEVVLQQLRKKRLDPKTVERVYEVGALHSPTATPTSPYLTQCWRRGTGNAQLPLTALVLFSIFPTACMFGSRLDGPGGRVPGGESRTDCANPASLRAVIFPQSPTSSPLLARQPLSSTSLYLYTRHSLILSLVSPHCAAYLTRFLPRPIAPPPPPASPHPPLPRPPPSNQVFDYAAWHQHRARFRYVEHCVTLFRSYFFRDLLGPLAVLVGLAYAVGSYETALTVSGTGWWAWIYRVKIQWTNVGVGTTVRWELVIRLSASERR